MDILQNFTSQFKDLDLLFSYWWISFYLNESCPETHDYFSFAITHNLSFPSKFNLQMENMQATTS